MLWTFLDCLFGYRATQRLMRIEGYIIDKMKTVFSLLIVLCIALNDLGAAGALLESQFTVGQGNTVTLPCTNSLGSSVDWHYHRTPGDTPQYVFSNNEVYDMYNRTFTVKKPTPHDYSLTITGAQLNDTGLYTCIEDGGLGNRHTASLLVVADLPVSTPTGNSAVYAIVISVEAMIIVVLVVLVIALIVALRRCKNRNESGNSHDVHPVDHNDTETENRPLNPAKPVQEDAEAAAATGEHEDYNPPAERPNAAPVEQKYQPLSVLPVFNFVKSTDSGSQVRGLCVLGDRVYVARDGQSHIDIYDRHTLTHVGKLDVCGDQHPCCMALCPAEKRLYVTYYLAMRVCKVNPSDAATAAPTSWTTSSEADGISVSASRSVIVALRKEDKLDEFAPDGTLLRSIPMPDGVGQPRHAIQLRDGMLLVCFGHMSTRGTCLLDEDGQLVKQVDSRTKHPLHLAVNDRGLVFVADFEGDHVTVLDGELDYACEAVAASAGVTQPFRVCFDDTFRRVYVGEFSGRCRVLSYDIQY